MHQTVLKSFHKTILRNHINENLFQSMCFEVYTTNILLWCETATPLDSKSVNNVMFLVKPSLLQMIED